MIYAVAQNTKAGCDREISMLYGKVDAYVVVGSCALQKNVEKIVQMNMPVALFQTRVTLDGAMALQVDNEQGGYLAASELLSRGYQRIGYLHGSPDGSFWEGEERFSGFKKCMERAGCTIEKEFFGNRDYGNAYRLTKQIVESGIDALFCETDLMAYGVLQGLYEAKVAVPDRLAVLGFDNTKFVNYESQVHLSTIGQPLDAMAEYTAKAIVNKIERNQDYAKFKKFEAVLSEKETV